MELIAEVLENYPKFFEKKHQDMLWAAVSGPWGLEILNSLDAETVSLSRIVVAYGQILLEAKVLYQQPEDPHHQQVMSFLHDLLKYPEIVGVDDDVAPVVLEFWSSFVSTIAEETFTYTEGDQLPSWMQPAKTNVFQAVSELAQKIIYPSNEVTSSWDSDTRKTFKVFRIDVRDIILEAYETLRDAMTDQFIDFALRALETGNWLDLEAGLFCLISIADAFNDTVDARLRRLFEQPLFSAMSGETGVPAMTRRTAVEAVAALNSFFLRNPQFLPQVLPFLLKALAQPPLAHSAAKSFASLCSECRKSLTGELNSFFQMYEQFLTYQTAEEFTKSKVLEGIAAIVQALDSEEKQLAGVRQLFGYIAQDAMGAIQVTKEGKDPEQGQVLALTTLKCLSSIGRALQAQDEEVVDLESERKPSTFWLQGRARRFKTRSSTLSTTSRKSSQPTTRLSRPPATSCALDSWRLSPGRSYFPSQLLSTSSQRLPSRRHACRMSSRQRVAGCHRTRTTHQTSSSPKHSASCTTIWASCRRWNTPQTIQRYRSAASS